MAKKSRARRIVESWPEWKQDAAIGSLRPKVRTDIKRYCICESKICAECGLEKNKHTS